MDSEPEVRGFIPREPLLSKMFNAKSEIKGDLPAGLFVEPNLPKMLQGPEATVRVKADNVL